MTDEDLAEMAPKVAQAMFAQHARGQDFSPDLQDHDQHTWNYWHGQAEAAIAAIRSLT